MTGKRGKKQSRKVIKLPEGAASLTKYSDNLQNVPVEERVVQFVTNLSETPWEPHSARPKSEVFGFYYICRWYSRESSWVVLYAGRGHIRACLDQHFSGHDTRTPISNYLSSFSKNDRSLIWLKWAKDPFYPYEGMSLDDVLTVLSKLYSSTEEKPPFNMDLDVKDEKLPDDFSIIPNWNKSQKKKTEATQS